MVVGRFWWRMKLSSGNCWQNSVWVFFRLLLSIVWQSWLLSVGIRFGVVLYQFFVLVMKVFSVSGLQLLQKGIWFLLSRCSLCMCWMLLVFFLIMVMLFILWMMCRISFIDMLMLLVFGLLQSIIGMLMVLFIVWQCWNIFVLLSFQQEIGRIIIVLVLRDLVNCVWCMVLVVVRLEMLMMVGM